MVARVGDHAWGMPTAHSFRQETQRLASCFASVDSLAVRAACPAATAHTGVPVEATASQTGLGFEERPCEK